MNLTCIWTTLKNRFPSRYPMIYELLKEIDTLKRFVELNHREGIVQFNMILLFRSHKRNKLSSDNYRLTLFVYSDMEHCAALHLAMTTKQKFKFNLSFRTYKIIKVLTKTLAIKGSFSEKLRWLQKSLYCWINSLCPFLSKVLHTLVPFTKQCQQTALERVGLTLPSIKWHFNVPIIRIRKNISS